MILEGAVGMAIVATYTSENCPGMPRGVVARIHDDCLAEDQNAAWARAREVHERIYWAVKRRQLAETAKEAGAAG